MHSSSRLWLSSLLSGATKTNVTSARDGDFDVPTDPHSDPHGRKSEVGKNVGEWMRSYCRPFTIRGLHTGLPICPWHLRNLWERFHTAGLDLCPPCGPATIPIPGTRIDLPDCLSAVHSSLGGRARCTLKISHSVPASRSWNG
ncbi:hypothetical protein BD309DRAFT_392305 [Dichomitus squalens]|nr:hypothetical protein BD309DRAFT_392305 [Dichomitus squalens]